MTISVYFQPPRNAKRTSKCWAVTIMRGSHAVTERFDTERQARAYAALPR